MTKILVLLGCLCVAANVAASGKKSAAPAPSFRQSFAKQVASRANAPVVTATSAGPGQAGYVHYFLLRKPDASYETQIGIELADRSIAWSFPELGVAVSPFIAAGPLAVNGKFYEVRHQYGIRPFPDDQSMRVLQEELARRVMPWAEDETPYCERGPSGGELCVSCLGFALRILFPGPFPSYPSLPRDFTRANPDAGYTTDDLLLYLAGLHGVPTAEARLQRIDGLTLPPNLREELVRLVKSTDPTEILGTADAVPPKIASAKPRAGAKAVSKVAQQRVRQRRNL